MKNFFEHMKYKYNTEITITLKHYCRQKKSLAKQKERLQYLLSCKDYGMIPKHLSNTTAKTIEIFTSDTVKTKFAKMNDIFLHKILKLEIKQTHINIKTVSNNIFHADNRMKSTLNDKEYSLFVLKQRHMFNYVASQTKMTHSKKLNKLKDAHIREIGFTFNESWFVNNTSIEFPEESKWLLSLGKKFAIPITKKNFSPIHVIADVEQCIQRIQDEKDKDVARLKIANNITTFQRKISNNTKEKFILKAFEITQKIIRKHKNKIIITNADKGNKTVIMYKLDYTKKMQTILDDKNTYKTTRIDPTIDLQKRNNSMVNDLFKQKYIDAKLKTKLYCSAALAPRLYGLPKIHKPGLPLRPISSSYNVPCYQLSKHIGETLKIIISPNYNIKNSYQLKEKLNDIFLEEDDILVSFDVISLFTNIPTYLAIKNIMKQWETIKTATQIPKPQYLKILEFCLRDNNYFRFEDKIYLQTFGMPMGNPLSPTIADIVLDNLLDNALDDLKKTDTKIKLIVKYVDDIFAIIKERDTDIILKTLNSYHKKLQFTIETECNKCLPYLDTKLHRQKDKIVIDRYSKETSSGRMMNFHSTQPMSQKINTATNFTNKVIDISDKQFHEENVVKIKNILKMNNYPNYIINEIINNKINHNNNNRHANNKLTTEIETGNTITFFSIPYIPKLTQCKILHEVIKQDNIKMTFAYKANCTLRKLFSNTKTPIEKEQQLDVVYQIGCLGNENDSCDLVYIGTTKRALGVRIAEHKADIRKNKTTTGLSQHIDDTHHTADFDNVKILDKEKRVNTRYTIESLRIQEKLTKAMNTKEDKDNIKSNYSVAIKKVL